MNVFMGRSVHISTQIPPPLSRAEHLGISKARQKQLIAIIRDVVDELHLEGLNLKDLGGEEAKPERAATTRSRMKSEIISGAFIPRKKQKIAAGR